MAPRHHAVLPTLLLLLRRSGRVVVLLGATLLMMLVMVMLCREGGVGVGKRREADVAVAVVVVIVIVAVFHLLLLLGVVLVVVLLPFPVPFQPVLAVSAFPSPLHLSERLSHSVTRLHRHLREEPHVVTPVPAPGPGLLPPASRSSGRGGEVFAVEHRRAGLGGGSVAVVADSRLGSTQHITALLARRSVRDRVETFDTTGRSLAHVPTHPAAVGDSSSSSSSSSSSFSSFYITIAGVVVSSSATARAVLVAMSQCLRGRRQSASAAANARLGVVAGSVQRQRSRAAV